MTTGEQKQMEISQALSFAEKFFRHGLEGNLSE
jgi:hypothetical protein